MCEKDSKDEHNHGFADGKVWSDIGYNTNGSENGVYLPGSYAVGGGRGGLRVWHSMDNEPDEEHDEDYINEAIEKLPEKDYKDYMLMGKKGKISHDNPCWHYVSKATDLMKGAQFHDRHVNYSKRMVKEALTNLHARVEAFDITASKTPCKECQDRNKNNADKGLPTPYVLVKRLETMSTKLKEHLTAADGKWKPDIYTSLWMKNYMAEVKKSSAEKVYIKK